MGQFGINRCSVLDNFVKKSGGIVEPRQGETCDVIGHVVERRAKVLRKENAVI
jgi:hypothetical protein